ncbi:unnamed protein product [Paramecium octaurelia]|uniref:Reverse transcriptase domain-containing protein n=1 Tax=Paramecium octaurelia TaxID=43137 RepID=A0A8S1VBL1_PAROT|nr:unnamed protein product [Paramecium octaurelia]
MDIRSNVQQKVMLKNHFMWRFQSQQRTFRLIDQHLEQSDLKFTRTTLEKVVQSLLDSIFTQDKHTARKITYLLNSQIMQELTINQLFKDLKSEKTQDQLEQDERLQPQLRSTLKCNDFQTWYNYKTTSNQKDPCNFTKSSQKKINNLSIIYENGYIIYSTKLQVSFPKYKRMATLNPQKTKLASFDASRMTKTVNKIYYKNQTEFPREVYISLSALLFCPLCQMKKFKSYKNSCQGQSYYYRWYIRHFYQENKKSKHIKDLWNDNTRQINKYIGQASVVPLNKLYTKIPSKQRFRPFTILSPLFARFKEFASIIQNMNKWLHIQQRNISRYREISLLFRQCKQKGEEMFNLYKFFKCILHLHQNQVILNYGRKISIKLERINIPKRTILVTSLLRPYQRIEKCWFKNGGVQGSPLSPSLFNIYLDAFLQDLSSK